MGKIRISFSSRILAQPLRCLGPAAALLALLLGLSGCASIEQQQAKELSAEGQVLLQTLLDDAQDALSAGQVSASSQTPDGVGGIGAAELFYQALSIQPDNPAAQRGLEQILEQYLARGTDAAEAGDFSSSYALLNRARSIDTQHPSIGPAQAYIDTLNGAEVRSIVVAGLSPTALNQVIDSLVLEVKPSVATCRFRIFAPSDAQTRALYQALRDGFVRNNLSIRIRASTTISQPTRLERICNP